MLYIYILFEGELNEIFFKNSDNPSALLYSQLDKLECFRNDGKFHLRIVYPELGGSNEWIQKSNPVADRKIEGFKAVKLDYKIDGHLQPWRGLGLCRSDKSTLICDTPARNHWWMAVGAKSHWPSYKKTIPGRHGAYVKKVELFVLNGKKNSKF